MAATSDSDSSSSSDDEQSLGERANNNSEEQVADAINDESADAPAEAEGDSNDVVDGGAFYENSTSGDSCKVFLSRIPQMFNDETIKRILEEHFGDGCVVEVSIVCERAEDGESVDKKDDINIKQSKSGKDATAATQHRGFGFVTFSNQSQRDAAIEAGTVRGSAKSTSKRKHTFYIRPVVRDDDDGNEYEKNGAEENKNICFLWKKNRCPYGDDCKFVHEGDGGCVTDAKKGGDEASQKKKQKCFAFKKSGKCKLGDECPYSHDVVVTSKTESGAAGGTGEDNQQAKGKAKVKSQIDCINWKNKGKCRKGEKCPFRHDEAIRDKVLAKKKGNKDDNSAKRKRDETKIRQSLSIRVFGLNYETTQEDIRKFFAHCGPIMEITFPTFEDSGRSKGYCGVLFQSPKAVQKAVEMDGNELQGRWLRIQEGKMYLRKWEEVEKNRVDAKKVEKMEDDMPLVGEYGQKVKKRKKHGFKD
ncbi:hypothetical protein ACHAXR_012481 [Thalassiosira sp. AJA248-18]